jgi:hypothetical protein
VEEQKTSGVYSVGLDASQLTSGIYFYKLSSGIFSSTRKMILLQ